MRLVGPDDGCKQVEVAGRIFDRRRDGTFNLPDGHARLARKSGDFTEVRTRMAGTGFVCADCGFVAVIRDHCGRCGGTSMTRED